LLDANLFVAAVRRLPRVTPTLEFILAVLDREDCLLVGNVALATEYARYATMFSSPLATELLHDLLARTRMVVPHETCIQAALQHGLLDADALHAAVCMDREAILVSNDHDFDAIAASGNIKVWSISRAMRELGR
jgi:predicted nucleic acid-binding protein